LEEKLSVYERRACAALWHDRSTPRRLPNGGEDVAVLTADIVELARTCGRHGYRRITALVRRAGWLLTAKQVARIWRREGLNAPTRHRNAAVFGSTTALECACAQSKAIHVWACPAAGFRR